MKLPRYRIGAALAELSLKPAMHSKKLGQKIAAYLLTEHRTTELDSLLRDIIQSRASRGIIEVTATSVHPLSATVRADIEKEVRRLFTHTKYIIINERIDSTLVGGVRLELVDCQLDLSVRSKLNQLKASVVTD